MESSIYERLQLLPLFLGMSKSDLAQAVGQAKFGFHQFAPEDIIIRENAPCNQLLLLQKGTIKTHTDANDHGFTVIENLHAPAILQPEYLFGLHQYHTKTFIAKDTCHIISLGKNDVARLSEDFPIFRINLLNIISTLSQKMHRLIWNLPTSGLEDHIINFFVSHCSYPAGNKTFKIKMTRLANEVNDSRLDVSRALNKLQDLQLIKLYRGQIEIPAIENLIGYRDKK